MQTSEEVRKRFFRIFEELRYRGIVSTKKEFSLSLGIDPANYSRMKVNNSSFLTLDQLNILFDKYDISPEWLFLGRGKIFLSTI